jgi:hypothetical protein
MAISSNGLPTVPIPAIQTWRIPPMATDHAEQQISDENEPFRDRPRTALRRSVRRMLSVTGCRNGLGVGVDAVLPGAVLAESEFYPSCVVFVCRREDVDGPFVFLGHCRIDG